MSNPRPWYSIAIRCSLLPIAIPVAMIGRVGECIESLAKDFLTILDETLP